MVKRRPRSIVHGALVAVLVLALGVAACGDDGTADGDEPRVVTAAESGDEIALVAGERFEVHLESNPSTGFRWELSEMTTDGLVTLGVHRYEEPSGELVGAGGTEVFEFTAGARAAGIVRLEYVRPFDDPIVPERVVEFVVRIDDALWPPSSGAPPSTAAAEAPG